MPDQGKTFIDAIAGREPDPHTVGTFQDSVDLRKFPLALLGDTEPQSAGPGVVRQGDFEKIVGVPQNNLGGNLGVQINPNQSAEDFKQRYGDTSLTRRILKALGGDPSGAILYGTGGDPTATVQHEFRHRALDFAAPEIKSSTQPAAVSAQTYKLGPYRMGEEGLARFADALTRPTQQADVQKWMDQQGLDINVQDAVENQEVISDFLKMQKKASELAQQRGAPRPYTHFR